MVSDYFHVQLRQSVHVLLPLEQTAEVINLTRQEICPIPGIPHPVLGVINQRGKLLWVLELAELLGLEPLSRQLQSQDKFTLVVITSDIVKLNTHKLEQRCGCVVSVLKGIVSLDPAEFKPVYAGLYRGVAGFLSGVAEIEQTFAAVVNTNAVLTAVSDSMHS